MQGPLLRSELIRVEVQFWEIITPYASSLHYPGSHGTATYQSALVKNSSEEEEARSGEGGWERQEERFCSLYLSAAHGEQAVNPDAVAQAGETH